MKNEKTYSTYTTNSISVVEFGAINHISSLMSSLSLYSPLILIDSRVQHISYASLMTPPFVLDVTKSEHLLLKELETHVRNTTVDSIIVISDQKGLDIAKLFLYTFITQNKENALALIAIPTSYTTRTLESTVSIYDSKEKQIDYYHHKALEPKMVIIDERAVTNRSAKEKALSVVAIIAGFLDILHHTPYASYEYFLARTGLSICKEYGYKAAHSPHDSESRHQILFASHLLSLISYERGSGILEVMASSLHKVSGASYPLLMSILLPCMTEVLIHANKEIFKKLSTFLEASSMKDAIHTLTTTILEPIHPPIEMCLYDIIEEETHEHVITLEHIKDASRLTFNNIGVSMHPSIIDEDTIIRYFESVFWGYTLPKEWI